MFTQETEKAAHVDVLEELARQFFAVEAEDKSLRDLPHLEEEWNEGEITYKRIGTMSKSLSRVYSMISFLGFESKRLSEEVYQIQRQPGLSAQYKIVKAKHIPARLLFEAATLAFRGLLLQEVPATAVVLDNNEWHRLQIYKGGIVVLATYPDEASWA